MPPDPVRARTASERPEALLADLGPRVRRGGGVPRQPPPLYASGLPTIDALLGGGFPGGGLSEIAGPLSSGRTSVPFSLLARATRRPPASAGCNSVRAQGGAAPLGLTAWIDRIDAFDPASAEAAGVALEKVLWLRVTGTREALRCAERLLETEGIRLIVLDLTSPPLTARPTRNEDSIPASAWIRLARRIAGTPALLLVLSDRNRIGSQAEIALAMQPIRAHFGHAPAFFEQLEARVVLVRHRTAPERLQMQATIHLGAITASEENSNERSKKDDGGELESGNECDECEAGAPPAA